MLSDKINTELIDQITDRFLYLENEQLLDFIKELKLVIEHHKVKRNVNHSLENFKFKLDKAIP